MVVRSKAVDGSGLCCMPALPCPISVPWDAAPGITENLTRDTEEETRLAFHIRVQTWNWVQTDKLFADFTAPPSWPKLHVQLLASAETLECQQSLSKNNRLRIILQIEFAKKWLASRKNTMPFLVSYGKSLGLRFSSKYCKEQQERTAQCCKPACWKMLRFASMFSIFLLIYNGRTATLILSWLMWHWIIPGLL